VAQGYKPGSLTERVQTGVREAMAQALAHDPSPAEWMVENAFRSRLALAPVDLAAMEIARALAEALPDNPPRVKSLVGMMRAKGALPYAVVGDSHSAQLVRRAWRDDRWLLPLHQLCTGASARGLANPEAAAGAGAKVRAFLDALAGAPMPVVLKFGQVDIEFVFTFKRLETDATAFDERAFDAFAEETVDRYVAFLQEAVPKPLRARTWVAGVFPPALSDRAWREGYVNAHIADLHGPADTKALRAGLARLELPPLAERTRLHKAFNTRLFGAADAAGFKVMFGFKALLDEGGAVRPRYLGRARGGNHHLGYAATRAPVLEQLWKVVG
jgi:hypothetical protein